MCAFLAARKARLHGHFLVGTLYALGALFFAGCTAETSDADHLDLGVPAAGSHEIRVLGPRLLELELVQTKDPETRLPLWDFVEEGSLAAPDAERFDVRAGGEPVPVVRVGFKRRAAYAPLGRRDLRVASYLYLRLADRGYTYSPEPYQAVYEADFSGFREPGTYRIAIPGLGASVPFLIDEGVPMKVARTFALGLYHQRCGAANEPPYTRFAHAAGHLDAAAVPTSATEYSFTWDVVASEANKINSNNPEQIAPRLTSPEEDLVPAADLSGDGVANLLVYAFGGDPLRPGSTVLPYAFREPVTTSGSGDRTDGFAFTVTFARRPDAADIDYILEISTDLRTWEPGVTEIEQIGNPVPDPEGERETVTYRVGPAAGGDAIFARVRVRYLE